MVFSHCLLIMRSTAFPNFLRNADGSHFWGSFHRLCTLLFLSFPLLFWELSVRPSKKVNSRITVLPTRSEISELDLGKMNYQHCIIWIIFFLCSLPFLMKTRLFNNPRKSWYFSICWVNSAIVAFSPIFSLLVPWIAQREPSSLFKKCASIDKVSQFIQQGSKIYKRRIYSHRNEWEKQFWSYFPQLSLLF